MSEIIKTRTPSGGPCATRSAPVRHALTSFSAEAGVQQPARPGDGPPPVPPVKPAAPAAEDIQRLAQQEYHRGLAEGRASGEEAARAECEQRMQEDRERLAQLEAAVHDQLALLEERLGREAYHFALAVAGRIVKKEVHIDAEIVIRQTQEALRRVAGVESVKLRLNPQDEAFVRERRSDLLSAADSVRDLVIEGDDKIERGGCILETASGTVDARISTQLEQIDAALFGQTLS